MQLKAVEADFTQTLLTAADSGWQKIWVWIKDSYTRAPALLLGLGFIVAVLPLALFGLAFRQIARPVETTLAIRRHRKDTDDPPTRTAAADGLAWPSSAYFEFENNEAPRYRLDRELIRLGREEDNEICIANKTVHRYHAVLVRGDAAEFSIRDLSSPGGNGVLVNGRRVVETRLKDGDTIRLGQVSLRFRTSPI